MNEIQVAVAAAAVATLLVGGGVASGYAIGVRQAVAVASCASQGPTQAARDDSAMRHFSETPAAPIQGRQW